MTVCNNQELIYKQYIQLKEKLLGYGKLMTFYWILSILGLFPLWLAVALGQGLWILSPLALFAESKTQEKIENNLPSKKEVKARYHLALFLCAFSTLGHLMFLLLWEVFAPVYLGVVSLLNSTLFALGTLFFTLPLFYAVGLEKGKPWFFLFLLTSLSVFVLNYEYITNSILKFWTLVKLIRASVILISGYFLSFWLSTKKT